MAIMKKNGKTFENYEKYSIKEANYKEKKY